MAVGGAMKTLLAAFLACMLLSSGCASRAFSMRSLPAETPAADNARAISRAAATRAAAQSGAIGASANAAVDAEPVRPADAPSLKTYDPWERANRFTYRFNARFDEAVFLPVADAYRYIPGPVRGGIHNFFSNLTEVPTVVNDALQWQLKSGVRSLGRFVVNSTIGIGGLFDVATRIHLPKATATFDRTLARWGVHPGPFVVLPLLGPSTLRQSAGMLGDYGISYGINVVDLYRGDKTYALGTVNAIDTRANTNFRYYATGSPFEYEAIRFLFMRGTLIQDDALHPRDRAKRRDAQLPAGQ
jgi:phospholipid-binding lipoprotein MlaA